jgi:hypothetical protein
MWQDIVIAIANLVFSISLLPQVYYGFKKRLGLITVATSLPTFTGLYIMAFALFTLTLYYSAALTFFTATLWLILFIQRAVFRDA